MMIICDPRKRFELENVLSKTDGKIIRANFTEKGTEAWIIY